jgi:hypothetical protein
MKSSPQCWRWLRTTRPNRNPAGLQLTVFAPSAIVNARCSMGTARLPSWPKFANPGGKFAFPQFFEAKTGLASTRAINGSPRFGIRKRNALWLSWADTGFRTGSKYCIDSSHLELIRQRSVSPSENRAKNPNLDSPSRWLVLSAPCHLAWGCQFGWFGAEADRHDQRSRERHSVIFPNASGSMLFMGRVMNPLEGA